MDGEFDIEVDTI